MIFKPKISHQKPIKPPLKADFNAYFTKKRMIFTPIYKICATPKTQFRVRLPAGTPKRPRDGKSPGLFSWYQLIQSIERALLRIGYKMTVNLQCDGRIAVS